MQRKSIILNSLDVNNSGILKKTVGSLLVVVLLAVTAFIKIPIPFTPVPLTLQTLVVLLAGSMLGVRAGMAAVAAYILIGIAGAPVFAGNVSGLTGIAGPTGGYLVGFMAAAAFTGYLVPRVGKSYVKTLGIMLAASAMILILGALHLSVFLNVSAGKAVMAGIAPFVAGDILKSIAAAAIATKTRRH